MCGAWGVSSISLARQVRTPCWSYWCDLTRIDSCTLCTVACYLTPLLSVTNAHCTFMFIFSTLWTTDNCADVRPLFQGGQDDNLSDDTTDDDNLFVLSEWTNQTKNKKLSKVTDPLARNLLSQILHRYGPHDPMTPYSTLSIYFYCIFFFLLHLSSTYFRSFTSLPALAPHLSFSLLLHIMLILHIFSSHLRQLFSPYFSLS